EEKPKLPEVPKLAEELAGVEKGRAAYAKTPDEATRGRLADALGSAAFAALFERKFAEARLWSEEAIRLAEQFSAAKGTKVRQEFIYIYGNYAHALLFEGQYEKALATY